MGVRLRAGAVAGQRGLKGARRSLLPLVEWFATPLNCHQDNR